MDSDRSTWWCVFLYEHGVFEVHVLLVSNLEFLPLARIMMQLALVQIRKEPKHLDSLTIFIFHSCNEVLIRFCRNHKRAYKFLDKLRLEYPSSIPIFLLQEVVSSLVLWVLLSQQIHSRRILSCDLQLKKTVKSSKYFSSVFFKILYIDYDF